MSEDASAHASRQRMLAAAVALMRGTGLAGAGINEIVRASGAPKGSVYHFFPEGKQQIAAEALESATAEVVVFIERVMSAKRSPATRVEALFAAFAERIEAADFMRSCAAGTVCLDLDAEQEALRGVVADALERYARAVAAQVDLGDAVLTRSFAGLVVTVIEGAYIRCRAERSSAPFREAGAWLAKLVRAFGRSG